MSCKAKQDYAYCETLQPKKTSQCDRQQCYKHSSPLTRLILVLIAEVAFHFEIRVRPNASDRIVATFSC